MPLSLSLSLFHSNMVRGDKDVHWVGGKLQFKKQLHCGNMVQVPDLVLSFGSLQGGLNNAAAMF